MSFGVIVAFRHENRRSSIQIQLSQSGVAGVLSMVLKALEVELGTAADFNETLSSSGS